MTEIETIKSHLRQPQTPGMRRMLHADLSRAISEASRAEFKRRSSERMALQAGNDRPWLGAMPND